MRRKRPALEERLPAPAPVHVGGRPLQPHRVAVRDRERREEHRECVSDQRRVEMLERPRSDDDQHGEDAREQKTPAKRNHALAAYAPK